MQSAHIRYAFLFFSCALFSLLLSIPRLSPSVDWLFGWLHYYFIWSWIMRANSADHKILRLLSYVSRISYIGSDFSHLLCFAHSLLFRIFSPFAPAFRVQFSQLLLSLLFLNLFTYIQTAINTCVHQMRELADFLCRRAKILEVRIWFRYLFIWYSRDDVQKLIFFSLIHSCCFPFAFLATWTNWSNESA